jgi:hypothetical protein
MAGEPPSRSEIEKLANKKFRAGLAERLTDYQSKQQQALKKAAALNNRGAYARAFIRCKQERVAGECRAFAEALAWAGTVYATPLDPWAEGILEEFAKGTANLILSSLQAEYDQLTTRTGRPWEPIGGRQEIDQAVHSALLKANLIIEEQRIRYRKLVPDRNPRSLSVDDAQTETGLLGLMQIIEKWRNTAGDDGGKITQEELAERVGLSLRAYSAAKTGKPRAKEHAGKLWKFALDRNLI